VQRGFLTGVRNTAVTSWGPGDIVRPLVVFQQIRRIRLSINPPHVPTIGPEKIDTDPNEHE